MSDEIQDHDVQEGTEMGWHGKTRVNPEMSIEKNWLRSWDYVSRPVLVQGAKGRIVKTGLHILGVSDVEGLTVGDSYSPETFKPVTNSRLLDAIAKAIDGHGLNLVSVGTIFNRGRQFISLGLDAAKFQVGGQEFKAFLNIGNGNNQSSPLWCNTSNTKIVCNNTFTLNMDGAGEIMRVKKTANSDLKIGEMGQVIRAMLKAQKEFAANLTMLHETECNHDTARNFFVGFVGTPDKAIDTLVQNKVDALFQLFCTGKGNAGLNFGDVFNAITDHFTHEGASGKGDAAAMWKNYLSSEFGSGAKKKKQAWEILVNPKLREGVIALGVSIAKLETKN